VSSGSFNVGAGHSPDKVISKVHQLPSLNRQKTSDSRRMEGEFAVPESPNLS